MKNFTTSILFVFILILSLNCCHDNSAIAPQHKTQQLEAVVGNWHSLKSVSMPFHPSVNECDTCTRLLAIQSVANGIYGNGLYYFNYNKDKRWTGISAIDLDLPDTIQLVTVSYDEKGRIAQMSMYHSMNYTVTYNDNNQIIKATDNINFVVRNFTYNSFGQLTGFSSVYSDPAIYPTPIVNTYPYTYPSVTSANPSIAGLGYAEFDSKRNPIYGRIPDAIQTLFSDSYFNKIFQVISSNNILKYSDEVFNAHYNYTYTSVGLPLTVTITGTGDISTLFLFKYTH